MSRFHSLPSPRTTAAPSAAVSPSSNAFQEGFAAAIARQQEIFGHPSFPGRERQAARMLSIADLSTGEIVEILATIPRDARHDRMSAAEIWDRALAANNGGVLS